MAYSWVVLRESVQITLTLTPLDDLEVKTDDVENSHITALITEKLWTVLGPEFGADADKRVIIVQALCRLKSTGTACRAHLTYMMPVIGYGPYMVNQDLWRRPDVRPNITGERYWSYVLW